MYVPLASRVETRMRVGDLVDRRNFGAQLSFCYARRNIGEGLNHNLAATLTIFPPGGQIMPTI